MKKESNSVLGRQWNWKEGGGKSGLKNSSFGEKNAACLPAAGRRNPWVNYRNLL